MKPRLKSIGEIGHSNAKCDFHCGIVARTAIAPAAFQPCSFPYRR